MGIVTAVPPTAASGWPRVRMIASAALIGVFALALALSASVPAADASVPVLASSYSGKALNESYNVRDTFTITGVTESPEGAISGQLNWNPPLVGSGPFTGTVSSEGSITMTIGHPGYGFTDIILTGAVSPTGSLSGTYVVDPNKEQHGSWEASPTGPPVIAPTPPKAPPAFGPQGVIRGLPVLHTCLSKRHFIIHIRRYPGISYVEAIVFLNHHTVGVVKSRAGQFSAPINLRDFPAGTFPVKITVITTSGSVISGTRTYHTCHTRIPFHGRGRL